MSEQIRPRRIHANESAFGVGDAEQIAREREELAELFLRQPLPHEQPDLATDRAQQLEQFRIRRPELPAEELHDAGNVAVGDDREAERCVQPIARGHLRAREIGILQHVGDPGWFARGPDPARQAHARVRSSCRGSPQRMYGS